VLRLHVLPAVGSVQLERFGPEAVADLYRRLREDKVTPSILFRSSVVLHRAFNVALRRRIVNVNPVALVERPRYRAKAVATLSIADLRKFLAAARGDRLEAAFVLCLTAGLRISEALALEWSDIDFPRRALSVQRALVEVNGIVEIGETKTAGSRRRVELGKIAIDALRRRQKAWKREQHDAALVFSTPEGKPLRRSNVHHRSFNAILERAELPKVTIHSLRHSSASLLLLEHTPVRVVQERLGHSSAKTTMDRYQHVAETLQREATNRLDALLGGAPKRKPRAQSRG
jgi:integrase